MDTLLDTIVNFIFLTAAPLAHLGNWGYFALFLIAFIESVIIVGSFIPGSVGIIFAGFLVAKGYYAFWPIFLAGVLGGVIGDALSFYLGAKSGNSFRGKTRFLSEAYLEKGRRFFERFGDKSVLIGRFTGPLRPLIPFIAGMYKMNKGTFLFWNITSAFVWIAFHLGLGHLFGTSLDAIKNWSLLAGMALLALIFAVAIFAVAVQQRGRFFQFFYKLKIKFAGYFLEDTYLGNILMKMPKITSFVRARFDRSHFYGLPTTVLLVVLLYLIFVITGIVERIIGAGFVASLDQMLINLAGKFYNESIVSFTSRFTALGGEFIVPIFAGALVLFLLFKNRRLILPFLFTGAMAEVFNLAGKNFIERARPFGKLVEETSYSFPSGHTTLSIAVYGFLIYIIFKFIKNESVKVWSFVLISIFIGLIGLSRVYLQVHYASDVLGGFILGGLCLMAGIVLAEYLLNKNKI